MKTYPRVLTIAGSDCSGGAGIQADIKTISALGAYAASVITAVTVQNTCGVSDVYPIPLLYVRKQLEAVLEDICPTTIKIGMITDTGMVETLAEVLHAYPSIPVVFDTVMVSSSGRRLMSEEAIRQISGLLFPLSTLITPNLNEVEVLTGIRPDCPEAMEEAAGQLLTYGSQAVLVKGGHLDSNNLCDVLCIRGEQGSHRYTGNRIESSNTHGTGCTLSSAIATYLALGEPLAEAVGKARTYVSECIRSGAEVRTGHGTGPLNHLHHPVPMHIFRENE